MFKYGLLVLVVSMVCIASDEKGKQVNSGMPLLSVSHITHSIDTPRNVDYPNLSNSQVFLLKEVETILLSASLPTTPPPSPEEDRTRLLKDVEEVVQKNQNRMMWQYSVIMVGGIVMCYVATKVTH